MSLYNMVNGFSPACLLLLPMLGRQASEYPRFRDCFLSDDGQNIEVYTRVGGGNRDCGFGEEVLYDDPNFVRTYDDEYDNTYGYYVFNVPDEWKSDFEKIKDRKLSEVSDAYVEHVKKFYPHIPEVIDKAFGRGESTEQDSDNG